MCVSVKIAPHPPLKPFQSISSTASGERPGDPNNQDFPKVLGVAQEINQNRNRNRQNRFSGNRKWKRNRRNRISKTKTFFPGIESEAEPSEPNLKKQNRNRNRAPLLKQCRNTEKTIVLEDHPNRKSELFEPSCARTVTEPNRSHPEYCATKHYVTHSKTLL